MKAFLVFALLAALAMAGGYLSAGSIAGSLESDTSASVLNNPYKLLIAVGSMPFAWLACTWSSLFGGNYTNCVYTHVYYGVTA